MTIQITKSRVYYMDTINIKNKRIFIKNYKNKNFSVKNDSVKYLILIEMKCDKKLTINNDILLISCSDKLIYKHFNLADENNETSKKLKLYK